MRRSLFRKAAIDLEPVQQIIRSVEQPYERLERSVRDEIARNREEAGGFGEQRQSVAEHWNPEDRLEIPQIALK